ncbi:hypothetical protein ACIOD2_17290 [Amycolatopsis sp. NPDC088138]
MTDPNAATGAARQPDREPVTDGTRNQGDKDISPPPTKEGPGLDD